MISVYVGVCTTRSHDKFQSSFNRFTDELAEKHSVCITKIKDTFLPEAQNKLAKMFLSSGYDYLLLLDDDHWGHTLDMFNCLLGANSLMATIKSYSRHYPYSCALMKKVNGTYAGIENGRGYQPCDLTGFPMTLLRRQVFSLLGEPFFRPTKGDSRAWATDRDFCERLVEKGIHPVGCFQHCLPHDDITEDNVFKRRYSERNKGNNIASYNLKNHQIRQMQGV